jgi:hypothetical protein
MGTFFTGKPDQFDGKLTIPLIFRLAVFPNKTNPLINNFPDSFHIYTIDDYTIDDYTIYTIYYHYIPLYTIEPWKNGGESVELILDIVDSRGIFASCYALVTPALGAAALQGLLEAVQQHRGKRSEMLQRFSQEFCQKVGKICGKSRENLGNIYGKSREHLGKLWCKQ